MNPIYKFELTAGNTTQRAFPIYKDDLAKDFEKESGQEFFRAKLSGKLTFESGDFAFIVSKAFDTQFLLEIYISYNAGQSWASYWRGTFWKTDCEFNEDDKTVIVQPTVLDQYNDVLAGMDKEYNLIELSPDMAFVFADKRPMIQVYVPGQSVVGCFLSGMWWEQDCEPEDNEQKLAEIFHFSLNKSERIIEVTQTGSPLLPKAFATVKPESVTTNYEITQDNYKFTYTWQALTTYVIVTFQIVRVSDNAVLWQYVYTGNNPPIDYPITVTLQPVHSDVSGTVELYLHDINVYARFVCDTPTITTGSSTISTYEIPAEDIVPNNRNYHRVVGYNFPETIIFSTLFTTTPTQWGIYQPGQYYFNPADNPMLGLGEAFPVARSAWGYVSIWFVFSEIDWIVERSARQQFTIKNAYLLSSVISVLLSKIAPGITHEPVEEYSEFLYSENLIGIEQTLLITPKSNIISSGYDQPAQKAPITLKNVLDMLRDCFRCYWFIDENNRFRIEHIQYFRNGGSYSVTPSIGINLVAEKVLRNNKSWSFARNQYQFDKPEMAARYQFGWMDDVTQLFEGYPIDIISKYVSPDKIEQINISQFTSDIDYVLLNPNEISKDGFVLMAGIEGNSGEYTLPYYNFQINGNDHYLQNAYVAFCFLQRYYAYDMPAPRYSINGVEMTAIGTKRLKTQSLNFPTGTDPNLQKLVVTELGNGMIEKLSVNLSSRNAKATLKYDTE